MVRVVSNVAISWRGMKSKVALGLRLFTVPLLAFDVGVKPEGKEGFENEGTSKLGPSSSPACTDTALKADSHAAA